MSVDERASRIIRTAMASHGIASVKMLAERSGIDATTLNSRMACRTKWTLGDLSAICHTLQLDITTRAALVGGKDRCKYE